MKRLFVVFGVAWFVIWGWIGWRGYEITTDVASFIRAIGPRSPVPQVILDAREAGQSYIRLAIIWGAAVPLSLLAAWGVKLVVGKRSQSRH